MKHWICSAHNHALKVSLTVFAESLAEAITASFNNEAMKVITSASLSYDDLAASAVISTSGVFEATARECQFLAVSLHESGFALAQHLPYEVFRVAAGARRLIGHGRDWEVSLGGTNLGFADGNLETALQSVHRREVNNALYGNEVGTPDFLQCSLPTFEALANYPDLIQQYGMQAGMVSRMHQDGLALLAQLLRQTGHLQPDSTPENAIDIARKLIGSAEVEYVLVQEGGSSGEVYIHSHDTLENAERDRQSCRSASYPTTAPVEVPRTLATHPAFFPAVEQIVRQVAAFG